MSVVHLISGLPCSGKSHYARALASSDEAVLFTLDRWLFIAFGRYDIEAVGYDEHVRRVRAMRELIWSASLEHLTRRTDVILDDGYFYRGDRVALAARARDAGHEPRIHFLATDHDLIRRRLETRNRTLGDSTFFVDPARMERFIAAYEPPDDDEGAPLVRVETTPS